MCAVAITEMKRQPVHCKILTPIFPELSLQRMAPSHIYISASKEINHAWDEQLDLQVK
jgi:hypothetical protein